MSKCGNGCALPVRKRAGYLRCPAGWPFLRPAGTANTDFFYQPIARGFLESPGAELPFTCVDLRVPATSTQDVALCKLFSPAHLLKQGADPNTLDRHFYEELLYLIGLEEVKDKSRRLIQRVAASRRQPGALVENTLTKLEAADRLRYLTPEQQAPIVALVEQVLAAKAADPAADTSAPEAEINALVAALYGLTPAEAAQL